MVQHFVHRPIDGRLPAYLGLACVMIVIMPDGSNSDLRQLQPVTVLRHLMVSVYALGATAYFHVLLQLPYAINKKRQSIFF